MAMAKMAIQPRSPTMRVTATEAKNRFGSLCAQAKREPVFVEKAGQLDSVILSLDHYQALQAGQNGARRSARKQAFEAEFGEWMAAQNAWVEAHGVPGADLRPW
jgi:post-segregation antitoxin (ccd killing protein)